MHEFQRNSYQHNTYHVNQHASMPNTSSSQPLLTKPPNTIPVKRLSPFELQEKEIKVCVTHVMKSLTRT